MRIKYFLNSTILLLVCFSQIDGLTSINRKNLVTRHNVSVTQFDSLSSLTVGNGEFAFTVDATGLQTFPELYKNGIPLGTQSQWGWHSFPNVKGYKYEEALREYNFNGRTETYPYQWNEPARKKEASDWFRKNPHRLHLGLIGFEIKSKSGRTAQPSDIKNIRQKLNLWTGEIHSYFEFENTPVEVNTVCHQEKDLISIRVISELVRTRQIKIYLSFPYPTGEHTDWACDFTNPEKHQSQIDVKSSSAIIQRALDETKYFVKVDWKTHSKINELKKHYFTLEAENNSNIIEFSCLFTKEKYSRKLPAFSSTQSNSKNSWKDFWMSGGAIDFSGSKDIRAKELERRIILSQYLTKIQCSGSMPPQETGLTCNSWFGKFHLEMHWWHAAHFAFWNRIELLEKSLDWYKSIYHQAKEIAQREGFDGIRWPKMTDPSGVDSPSKVGPFLIWQQPHFIYFAELCYRNHPNKKTLEKYKDLVFATADFMASYANYDSKNDRYILGKGIIAAQERFNPQETFNTPFELAYWHWGLSTALKWCERLGIKNNEWQNVLNKLSALPQKDNLYLAAESAPDSYVNPKLMTDHPAVLGVYGFLPKSKMVSEKVFKNTFDFVWKNWNWNETWGWDFPFTAMSAVRLYEPEKAIDALFMNQTTNTYLSNGHNYQDSRLRLYLPGNGGLLSAVAIMCAGFEGNKIENPGIPKNGKWKVRWEGLKPML